jgi:hypothetical protein
LPAPMIALLVPPLVEAEAEISAAFNAVAGDVRAVDLRAENRSHGDNEDRGGKPCRPGGIREAHKSNKRPWTTPPQAQNRPVTARAAAARRNAVRRLSIRSSFQGALCRGVRAPFGEALATAVW